MIIGDRVAALMAKKGLSQAELARRVGVKQPTIFKLIHDNKTGSAHLHKVARELETTPAYLTGETDDPTSDLPDRDVTAEEHKLIAALRQLSPQDRKMVMQITKKMAGREN